MLGNYNLLQKPGVILIAPLDAQVTTASPAFTDGDAIMTDVVAGAALHPPEPGLV